MGDNERDKYIQAHTHTHTHLYTSMHIHTWTSLVAQTVKRLAYNAGDLGSIPGSGRSSGEGNGTPLQYSCLENPMERGAWWATVHGIAKSRTRLSDFTSLHTHSTVAMVKSFK